MSRDNPEARTRIRIAFIVQTHKCLNQIERLVQTLRSATLDHLIVVSHDGPAAEIERISRLPGVTKVLPAVGGRGSFGLVDGMLSSINWLRSEKLDYDWLVMMSGQDYLVRPLADLEQKLASSAVDGYYHHFRANVAAEAVSDVMRWPQRESQDRYLYTYRTLKPSLSRLEQILLKIPKDLINLSKSFRLSTSYGLTLGRRAEHSPFDPQFELIGGSFWLTIRRACADYLVEYASSHPDIVDYYRRTLVPDESFAQTILYNSGQFNISKEELRYYDFSNSAHGRPKIIGSADLPELITSNYYIARKFDIEIHPAILDELDNAILSNAIAHRKAATLQSRRLEPACKNSD